MKRVLLVCVLCFCLIMIGCQSVEKSDEYNSLKTSNFVLVESSSDWRIVYHKETKVMYSVSWGLYNKGNFAILVNPDGTPMLWEK